MEAENTAGYFILQYIKCRDERYCYSTVALSKKIDDDIKILVHGRRGREFLTQGGHVRRGGSTEPDSMKLSFRYLRNS